MAYLLLLAVIMGWTWWAVRHKLSWRTAVLLYFSCCLLVGVAEPIPLRFLQLYSWRMQMFADPELDVMMASYIIGFLLNPLLGVLYGAYCAKRPLVTALLAALALGGLEVLLVRTGYLVYYGWNPLFTIVAFLCFFLIIWRLTLGEVPFAQTMTVLGAAIWAGFCSNIFLQGMLWLWHYEVALTGDLMRDNRILAALLSWLVITPVAATVSLVQTEHRWRWAVGGVTALILLESLAVANGFMVYHGWNLGYSVIQYALVVGSTALYANWVRDGRRQPIPSA